MNACSISIPGVITLLGTSLATPVYAAENGDAPVRAILATCAACHGERGESQIPQNPVLGGQHLYYLYVQLRDFKSGARASAVMQPIAAALEKEEMRGIAEYYSRQKWVSPDFQATPEQLRIGKRVVTAGQCVQCHLGGFEGNSRIPRAAGQHYEYLLQTMLDFKNRIRTNSPAKNSLMETFSAEEIEATAAYLSSLRH